MAGFCKHCGKELDDGAPYCPECGSPTGSYPSQTAYAPRKKGANAVAIAIIVAIIVFSIVAIALIPVFMDMGTTDKYTVTVTVESISVEVSDPSVYGMFVVADLSLGYKYGSSNSSHDFGMWIECPISGAEIPVHHNNTVKFIVSGDPTGIKYTAFLHIKKSLGSTLSDYADLYDVTGMVTSEPTVPLYYGCSGVTFDVDSYDGSVMTFKGDSDPIGCVKLTFTAVKN